MYQRIITGVLMLAVLYAAGCKNKAETPPAQQTIETTQSAPQPSPAAATGPSPVDGTWEIIAYYMHDMVVMPEAEAKTWVGRTLRFSSTEVVSGEVTCSKPQYSEIPMPRETLLGMDAGYPAGVLMLLADYDPLYLVNISCNGQALNALGRLIIKIDDDHIVAPWDNVYFEMKRDAAR